MHTSYPEQHLCHGSQAVKGEEWDLVWHWCQLTFSLLLDQVDIDLAHHTEESLASLATGVLESCESLKDWEYVSNYWKGQPAAKHLHVLVTLPGLGELKFAVMFNEYR